MSPLRTGACALWMAACLGLGWWAGRDLRRGAQLLEAYCRFAHYLQDSMLPLSLSFVQACRQYGQLESGPVGQLAQRLAQGLQQPCDPEAQFRSMLTSFLQEQDLTLEQEELSALAGLSHCLVARSGQELQTSLGRTLLACETLSRSRGEQAAGKVKLYQTLGFMAGAVALIWTL